MKDLIFCVGDRVAATAHLALGDARNPEEGALGTIVLTDDSSVPYLVEFDAPFANGHSGNKRYENKQHYWCEEESLSLIRNAYFEPKYENIFDVLE